MPASNHAAAVTYVEVPPGCYELVLRHSGSGSDPEPTPVNSPGCPGGTFSAGETILLTTYPSADWTVGGWVGTDDDGSFLTTNSLSMPSSDHTVRASYVTPTLVKDIVLGAGSPFYLKDGSTDDLTEPTHVGSTLFFAANDGIHGMELWKSDGTAEGTVMVKDIWPGASSAFPWDTGAMTWFSQTFVNVDGTVFFIARDGVHNFEVWKSDGTAAGTKMVKDIYDGWMETPDNLTSVGDTLFFTHSNGEDGVEIWKSDGTAAGTVMVKDINPGGGFRSR